ncbi:MAG TPA: hypothetical protein VHB47_19465 [Thermoanaerobaculia bacterium]|nr:hypothetical protein [Thermoanaerobaculia bacterium]
MRVALPPRGGKEPGVTPVEAGAYLRVAEAAGLGWRLLARRTP